MIVTSRLYRLDPKIKVLYLFLFYTLFHLVDIAQKSWLVGLVLHLALERVTRLEFHYLGKESIGGVDVDVSETISHFQ